MVNSNPKKLEMSCFQYSKIGKTDKQTVLFSSCPKIRYRIWIWNCMTTGNDYMFNRASTVIHFCRVISVWTMFEFEIQHSELKGYLSGIQYVKIVRLSNAHDFLWYFYRWWLHSEAISWFAEAWAGEKWKRDKNVLNSFWGFFFICSNMCKRVKASPGVVFEDISCSHLSYYKTSTFRIQTF